MYRRNAGKNVVYFSDEKVEGIDTVFNIVWETSNFGRTENRKLSQRILMDDGWCL